MSDVELSPMGAAREHAVPCAQCHAPTFNFSAVCNRCKDEQAQVAEGWERADEIGSRQ